MKQVNQCPRCGGKLEFINGKYECSYCGAIFEEEKVVDLKEQLSSLLDELKQEKVANLRTRLWEATHDKYQSKDKIVSIAREIRNYLPDDFMAYFYEIVNTKSSEEINEYLHNIDVKENYYVMDILIDYLITVMDVNNILAVNNLVEETFKNKDLELYNDYCTKVENEASKLEDGIYELGLTRDVFVAYSSKDMSYVDKVVKTLEENGISAFVAMRNLRHGKGAIENYDKALEEAMDNSKIFLFISSFNSRSLTCDALKKELPYLKKKDLEYAPAELRHDYNKLPAKYKKPRVQLLVGEKPKGTIADKMVNEIFDGFEWRYDVDGAVEAIFNLLTSSVKQENELDRVKQELEEKQLKQQEELKKMMENLIKDKEQEVVKTKVTKEKKAAPKSSPKEEINEDFVIEGNVLKRYKGKENIVVIPNGIKEIGYQAFYGCKTVTNITIPDSITSIANQAFWYCPIEEATIPAIACSHINKTALRKVVITSGTSISSHAFFECKTLTEITIPNSVISIGDSAFWDCTSLNNIKIPDSVTSIDQFAFHGCPIEEATIPAIASSHIKNSKLKKVTITSGTSIDVDAFFGCRSLINVTIPNSVTSIGKNAFWNCPIEEATIPAEFCLSFNSKNLKKVTITGGTLIGAGSLSNCTSLESITIPESITNIGFQAFYNCGIKHVYYSGDQSSWKKIKIDGYLFGGNKALRKAIIHYNSK